MKNSMACSFCSQETYSIFLDKKFYRCPQCKLIYNIEAKSLTYEEDYFEKEYLNQYNKTYLEDKKNIQNRMTERLNIALYFLQNMKDVELQKKITALEIGSAAGFFLEILQRKNIQALGWEISQKMTDYANTNNLKTLQGDFFTLYQKHKLNYEKTRQEQSLGDVFIVPKKFDLIAGFYVIEHLQNQKKFWQAIQTLIKKNGLLLLSMPSSFGPSFYFHSYEWCYTHPKDHFVDYSPLSIKLIAEKFGFQVLHVSAEGVHPHRLPLGDIKYFQKFYSQFIQKVVFSDTMFVVLKKII